MTIQEMYEITRKLIEDGKGDYRITYEAFCCVSCKKEQIEICDKLKEVDIS